MSLDTRRARNGARVCRQHDRRTHDEVGGARPARRLARGSALARRALPVSAQTEPSRRCDARGAVMSHDARRTRLGEYVCACRRRDRRADKEVGGARSARRLARARRSLDVAGVDSGGAEPAMLRGEDEGWARLRAEASGPDDCAVLGWYSGRRICLQGYCVSKDGRRPKRRLARGEALAQSQRSFAGWCDDES